MTEEGEITVPNEVLDRLGVKPGDTVEFYFDEYRTILRPYRPEETSAEE